MTALLDRTVTKALTPGQKALRELHAQYCEKYKGQKQTEDNHNG